MRIIVNGAEGRMGTKLRALLAEGCRGAHFAGGVDRSAVSEGVVPSFEQLCCKADCIVDFSYHAQVDALLAYAQEKKLPVVIATTGHTEAEFSAIRAASENIPVFFSGNMSLGIAVMMQLVQKVAAVFPDADVEIVESHHNGKVDVPSGTALMLAEAVRASRGEAKLVVGRHENGKRSKGEIGIHSLRLGGEVGTHEVIFNDGAQSLTLRHAAHDRALFAEGALAAAEYIIKKAPGFYTMKDIVE